MFEGSIVMGASSKRKRLVVDIGTCNIVKYLSAIPRKDVVIGPNEIQDLRAVVMSVKSGNRLVVD